MLESPQDPILQEDLEIIAHSKQIPWTSLEHSTLFITGATGLIGSQIIKAIACRNRLYSSKIRILAGVRNIEKAKKTFEFLHQREGLDFVHLDLNQKIDIEAPIDYLIHTASITSSKDFVEKPVDVIESSVLGTSRLLRLALQKKIKAFVYLSSMEAYGVVEDSSQRATEADLGYLDLTNVRSSYPESKRISELLCTSYASQYQVPVCVARLSQTFGAGVDYSENRVFAQFAKSVIEKKDIILRSTGLSYGNYCYTRDTIQAILLLLIKGEKGETYTVTNESTTTSIKEMAQMIIHEIADQEIKLQFDIPKNAHVHGYAPDTKLKLSSAKLQKLGWAPSVSLKEAYLRLIQSLKNQRK